MINPLGLYGKYQSQRAKAEGKQIYVDGKIGTPKRHQLHAVNNIIGAPDTFTYFGQVPDIQGVDDALSDQTMIDTYSMNKNLKK